LASEAIAKPINNSMARGINQPNHPIDPIKAKHSAFIMPSLLVYTLSEDGAAGDTEACSQTNDKDHLVLNHDISSYHVAGRDIALSIKNGRRRS
jgi:hypothetical protein